MASRREKTKGILSDRLFPLGRSTIITPRTHVCLTFMADWARYCQKKEVEKEKKNCGSYCVSACCWIFVWFTAPEWSTRNSPIAPNFSEWCAAAGIIVLYVSLERCIAGMSEDVFEKQGVAYSKGEYYVPTRHLSLHILFSFFIVNLDPRITRYMHFACSFLLIMTVRRGEIQSFSLASSIFSYLTFFIFFLSLFKLLSFVTAWQYS